MQLIDCGERSDPDTRLTSYHLHIFLAALPCSLSFNMSTSLVVVISLYYCESIPLFFSFFDA